MRTVNAIVFLLLSTVVFASDFEDRFDRATQLYHIKMFDSAAHQYESLIEDGYYSAELFYNTGNCYYSTNNLILASYHFLKARLLQPGNKNIQANLLLTKSSLTQDPPGYELIDIPWLEMIARRHPVNYWTWLALILLNAGFAGLLYVRFRKKGSFRNLMVSGSFLLVIAGSAAGIFSWYALKTLDKDHLGMIITEQPDLFSAPSATGTVVSAAPGGSIVEIIEETDSWCLVENESFKGWIKKESLKLF